MKVEKVRLDALKPFEKNIRKHSEYQIREFSKSIKMFGQTRPFVIDENNVILVGNCMFEAMKLLSMEEADAYIVKGLSETKKKKLVLSDNKIFNLGSDDYDALEALIQEIGETNDFEIPGFDAEVIRNILKADDEQLQGVLAEEESIDPQEKIESRRQDNQTQGDVSPKPTSENQPNSQGVSETPNYEQEEQESSYQESQDSQSQGGMTVTCPHCGQSFII